MRVCHLAYSFYENDNRIIRYAEAMVERGSEVDVISLRRHNDSILGNANGVRVYRIQRRSIDETGPISYLVKILWFLAKSALLLTVLQLRRRYDVVHVHNVPDFLVFAAFVPRLFGARVLLDIHDILPELYAGKFGTGRKSPLFRALQSIERLSCSFAHHVIVANHLWYERLCQRSVQRAKCTTILNYPDLKLFKPLSPGQRRSDGQFVFMYPGTLNHHQGVDIAIRAMDLIRSSMPDAVLHIYGEGPERDRLVALVDELSLRDRVKLQPRVPLREVVQLMASADAGLVPKRADGFGNEAFSTKILEFMACGIPVIVARTHVDEHYFDANVVRFFEPGDELSLAQTMQAIYDHREASITLAESAKALAHQLSWQERVGDYYGVIDNTANRRRDQLASRKHSNETT